MSKTHKELTRGKKPHVLVTFFSWGASFVWLPTWFVTNLGAHKTIHEPFWCAHGWQRDCFVVSQIIKWKHFVVKRQCVFPMNSLIQSLRLLKSSKQILVWFTFFFTRHFSQSDVRTNDQQLFYLIFCHMKGIANSTNSSTLFAILVSVILLGDESKLALDVLQAATFPGSPLNHQAEKHIKLQKRVFFLNVGDFL